MDEIPKMDETPKMDKIPKNLNGNKPIRWAGSAPPLLLIEVGLTYWQKVGREQSSHFSICSAGSDYSQEMHNYKYKLTYFLAFKSLLLCFDDFFLFHDGHP